MSDISILHICLSRGWGGLEMYPIRTGQKLLEKGYRVFGLALHGTKTCSGMAEGGFEVYTTKTKPAALTKDLFCLIQWIKKNNITVIHCHKSGDLLVAAIIKQFVDIKIIFTEHMGVKSAKKDLFHRWVYKNVDNILSISDETYRRNITALPVPKYKIRRLWLGTNIPDLITSSEQLKTIRESNSIPEEITIIGTIGRLSPGKGHINLVKAYAKVKRQYPNTLLLIVGGLTEEEGADLEYLAQLQDLIKEEGLTNNVLFTGFSKKTHDLYSIMDLVCLPYLNEAFGLTAIEAMAAGKPIIAANTGALPEILSNAGYYCDPNKSGDIARSILYVLKHKTEAEQQAKQARSRVEAEFSIENHIQKLLGYYKEETILKK